ncbi:MAG: hypothetical protein INQ03_03785 [Candidatus Heimdallarchaeota archaeon]|nr:hypothetical protein [Candidatus Heimdallarchaeota archaeon]
MVSLLWIIPPIIIVLLFVSIRTLGKFGTRELMWTREINKFKKANLKNLRTDLIVFTGSSSIRKWSTLEKDMYPLNVINRGFGGGRIFEVTAYYDTLIKDHKPKAVVFYAGENDLSDFFWVKAVSTPKQVLEDFKMFCEKFESNFPEIPLYFISIKPPKSRLKNWENMLQANNLIKSFCEERETRYFIDIVEAMTDDQGVILEGISAWDGIHMNSKGYEIWTDIIKPILLEHHS